METGIGPQMTFEVIEPVLIVGLGGAGSRMAPEAAGHLGADCLLVSNDTSDLAGCESVHVSTAPVVNPSVQLVRGEAFAMSGEIKAKMEGYRTVIMVGNLAGKAGAAIAPVISGICKEAGAGLVSFAIMPFGFEKDRIFDSGVSLKRLRADSACTIILDNDAMLGSNPQLTMTECFKIANSAMMHVIKSLGSARMDGETSVLGAGRGGEDIEASLKDSLKVLYGGVPPGSIKRSILYVAGGSNVPVGVIDSITGMVGGIIGGGEPKIDAGSGEPGVVMLAAIDGATKFDGYDPLGAIPAESSLDWETPDCSSRFELDLYQME